MKIVRLLGCDYLLPIWGGLQVPVPPQLTAEERRQVVRRLGPGAGPGQDQLGGLRCVPAPSSSLTGGRLQPPGLRVRGSFYPDSPWEMAPLLPTPGIA